MVLKHLTSIFLVGLFGFGVALAAGPAPTKTAPIEPAQPKTTDVDGPKTPDPVVVEPASDPTVLPVVDPPIVAKEAGKSAQPDTAGKEQLRCPKELCLELKFDPKTTHDQIGEALGKGSGMVLVDFDGWAISLGDKDLEPLNRYIHGVAERDGRVLLEPVYIGTREIIKIPLLHDVITTGYDVASRAYSLWKYRDTRNYHAKVLYHPTKKHLMFVYFIHRNFGDVCVTLRSRCDVVEYTDSETFDLALSKQLERAIQEGKEVRVVFTGKKPVLPQAELTARAITNAKDSVRIYKWMVASGEVRKRSMVKQRVIGLNAVTSAINFGLKTYDLVKAYLMYRPARSMKAEVQTSPAEGGNEVQLIIFTPTGAKENSSCLF